MTGSGYGYWPLSAKSADGEITAAMWHRNMPHLIRTGQSRAHEAGNAQLPERRDAGADHRYTSRQCGGS
ncbi:hypothetical protein HA38_04675 [Pantoea allii]|uniref:hypothetical protein n=1 Tax=Pantoea allii TaxID=574096 RepID=UPI000A2461EE|nr:hypothetical protein HA38_04675 [Pantoea allii]PBK01707.1 hypothetical protein CMR03_04440 [Pantoea allii]